MTTATKFAPSKVPSEPDFPVIDITAHEADLKRRQAERDARREEMRKCLNPAYAALKEAEKPVYKWTVRGEWLGPSRDGEGIINMQAEQTVTAQNENDAWAMFCDRIGFWPSRRDAQPIIKRGKQLSTEDAAAARATGVESDAIIPTVVIGPIPKKSRR